MDDYLRGKVNLEKDLKCTQEELEESGIHRLDLVTKVAQLSNEIDNLKQEKYNLQLNVESQRVMVNYQAIEIEKEKELYENCCQNNERLQKENSQLSKKLDEKIKELNELKISFDEMLTSHEFQKQKIAILENELKEYKNKNDISLNETNSEDYQKCLEDLDIFKKENQNLKDIINTMQSKLDGMTLQNNKFLTLIDSLNQDNQDKDKELQSYSVIVEKANEEKSELRAEIELLKLEQTDVKRRGNSVFSEVDDHRKAVEKELLLLRDRYKHLEGKYKCSASQQLKMKNQVAILLGMLSKKIDHEYMQTLENNLCAAKKEVEYLTNQLAEQMKMKHEIQSISPVPHKEDGYDYLRILYLQAEQKIENLEKELQSQRVLKVAENDKLLETQRKLYRAEKEAETYKGEMLKLQLKIQELTKEDENVPLKPKVEMIPGFENKLRQNSADKNVNLTPPESTSLANGCESKNKNIVTHWQNFVKSNVVDFSAEDEAAKKKVTFSPSVMLAERSTNKNKIEKQKSKRTHVTNTLTLKATDNSNCAQQ